MIYIHIPYCHRKCTYCAFYSSVTKNDKQEYVDALCHELSVRKEAMTRPLRTVYFGGGTPSLLTLDQLSQIVDTLRRNYDTSALEEVTLEANPEDLTPSFLHRLNSLNFFNRISIGIQSFSDNDLKLLNRRHSASQSIEAINNTHQAGFRNISIDLIYGLPGQTLEDWKHNLETAQQLPFTHLSAYALTVEEGTMLHQQIEQKRLSPAEESVVIAQYQHLLSWSEQVGLKQYEVSNFAKPGCKSRHNSRYWDRTPYLGVGAAAHSFDGKSRRWNIADGNQYIQLLAEDKPYFESETLSATDAHNEYLMTALRTTEGIDKSLVNAHLLPQLMVQIRPYINQKLIEETPTHLRPTPEGLLHADGIAADLFI